MIYYILFQYGYFDKILTLFEKTIHFAKSNNHLILSHFLIYEKQVFFVIYPFAYYIQKLFFISLFPFDS